MRAERAAAGALILAALAGCGGGDKAAPPKPKDEASAGAAIIRDWAESVRKGDYRHADALFSLPAVIANGVRIKATRRDEVSVFNRSLPCGAVLTATKPIVGGRLLATFKLVEGQGGTPCSGSAQVTFLIKDDHIVEWLRESDPDAPPPGSTQV